MPLSALYDGVQFMTATRQLTLAEHLFNQQGNPIGSALQDQVAFIHTPGMMNKVFAKS